MVRENSSYLHTKHHLNEKHTKLIIPLRQNLVIVAVVPRTPPDHAPNPKVRSPLSQRWLNQINATFIWFSGVICFMVLYGLVNCWPGRMWLALIL